MIPGPGSGTGIKRLLLECSGYGAGVRDQRLTQDMGRVMVTNSAERQLTVRDVTCGH